MAATAEQRRYTVAEYLEFERRSDVRHEFLQGELRAMVGESGRHGAIKTAIAAWLWAHAGERECQVFVSDMRVEVGGGAAYLYPDVVVSRGAPAFDVQHPPALLNPRVLIEVLSPTTEAHDRGKKFEHYRKLPSLVDFVLVAQVEPHVEHFSRQADGRWLLSAELGGGGETGLDATLDLPSLGAALPLADIYHRVSFDR